MRSWRAPVTHQPGSVTTSQPPRLLDLLCLVLRVQPIGDAINATGLLTGGGAACAPGTPTISSTQFSESSINVSERLHWLLTPFARRSAPRMALALAQVILLQTLAAPKLTSLIARRHEGLAFFDPSATAAPLAGKGPKMPVMRNLL